MKKLWAMLLVVAMLCGMCVVPALAEENIEKAYLDILSEAEREYGFFRDVDSITKTGIGYATLIDFNNDGIKELLYCTGKDERSEYDPNTYEYHIYSYDNGKAKFVTSGNMKCHSGEVGWSIGLATSAEGYVRLYTYRYDGVACSSEYITVGEYDGVNWTTYKDWIIQDNIDTQGGENYKYYFANDEVSETEYENRKNALSRSGFERVDYRDFSEEYLTNVRNRLSGYSVQNADSLSLNDEYEYIPIDGFDQSDDSLESWFMWLPMNTYNKQTYHDRLDFDFGRAFHEMIIPFDVGVVSESETEKVVSKNNLPNGLCKIYYLNEMQQTFNAVYNTNIDMASLDGVTMDGHVLVRVIDNYFVVIQGHHGTVVNPNPKRGYKIGPKSSLWVWYYQDEWNTNDLIYTIISYKTVAGYDVRTIDYISFEPPSDELLAQYAQQEITVTLNDKEIAFDQPPIIRDGRTLVPMRAIFEAMSCEVIWDGDSQQVDVYKNGDNVMTLWIDKSEMWTENGYITLDVPPQIIGEHTLVPVRAISEALDCDVDWNGDTRTVIITAEEDLIKTKMVKIYQYDDKSLDKADFEKTIKINDTEYNVTYKQTEKYDWKTDNIDNFEFTINGSKLKYNDYFDYYFSIKDVYLADLDPNDKCVELLISTVSDSATNTITAFQYKNGRFSQLKFHNTWVMNEKNNLELFLGSNYHGMVMNEDNSITLTGKTSSYGMWGIKKTFRLDKNNRITQDNQDMYEVDINEFMDRQTMTCDDLMRNHYIDSESEYDMYLNNYALCKRDYGCLKKGDYFTIVYDDDKGNVFVRTTDGKEGWIEIKSLSTEVRESISKLMFYMAS